MTTATSLRIFAEVEPTLSYAVAHNRITVVHRLSLAGWSGLPKDAVVRLSFEDAQGRLSVPWQRPVTLESEANLVIDTPDIRLDPAQLLLVEEQRPGQLRVTVEADDTVIAEASFPVRVLAAHQWLAVPTPLSYELLASYVIPNDPAVGRLIAEASALLASRTGSSAIEGYQSGAERVDKIVEALYDAMVARDIHYAEPPASWGDKGQKVRTPSEVLENCVGTCLDTVVVLAAALEQAGIRPVLWLVHGHAFLGYWRDETALDAVVETDVGAVVNQVQLGNMGLVETTMITGGAAAGAFADSRRRPLETWLTGDLDRVTAVVDIWAARRNSIFPLPSRTRDAEGVVQVVEYVAANHSRPQHIYTATRPASAGQVAPAPARVQQWKNALLDLSLRNKLINFNQKTSLVLAVPPEGLGTLEDLVNAQQGVSLVPGDAIDAVHQERGVRSAWDLDAAVRLDLLDNRRAVYCNVATGAYLSRLRSLAYKARTIVEETGANNLYLALGSLVWDVDGKPLRSPLVLVPVNLVTKSRGTTYTVELDESGSSTPNFCLLEKLKQVHGLEIPGLANPVEDESGIDLDAALRSVRVAVAEAGLPYRVEESADIAILQFAKFRLWKDLDEHWSVLMQNSLVRHLVETPTEPFDDPQTQPATDDLDGLDGTCPIPADSSQLLAVARATAGHTFVLEGPPGTGKSQTITNLLTRAIAEGKKVLFVAEKRAALDVVHTRLAAVGMSPFCLDLHDKASKPAVVREQIRTALDHKVQVDTQGFQAATNELRSARSSLARYAERLHEPNRAGLSYYSARTKQLTIEELDPLPVPVHLVTDSDPEQLDTVLRALEDLPDVSELAQPRPGHPWGFLVPADLTKVDVLALSAASRDAASALASLPQDGTLGLAIASVATPSDLRALAALAQNHTPLSVLDEAASDAWSSSAQALTAEIGAFVAAAHPGLDVATPEALALPLADLHARASAAAQGSFFGRKKKLKAIAAELAPALRPGASLAPKQVPALLAALMQVHGAVHGMATRAGSVPGVRVPSTWNPLTEEGRGLISRQVEWIAWAAKAVRPGSGAEPAADTFRSALRSYLSSPSGGGQDNTPVLQSAVQRLELLTQLAGASDDSWRSWAAERGLVQQLLTTAGGRGDADAQVQPLRRWLAFLEGLEPLRRAGLQDVHEALLLGRCHASDARQAFEAGLAATSLHERAAATGLDAFDAERHMITVGRFEGRTKAVRKALTDVIPSEVLGARPFRAGVDRGQVGALTRELARQRRGLGVRKLLGTYGSLITDVMPCVLVSPDSVSRFFPVGSDVFDLVVFDEASQIRVADAVGAMGRAQAVVVVGDSKQMPPTSFAEPSSGTEDESETDTLVVEDEESILSECVQAGVSQLWLSWHYRSMDESLIAFSNQRYYEGKLSSFPGPVVPGVARPDAGISLRRVNGTFQRSGKGKLLRTNDEEAREVVAEIRKRFAASPGEAPSIGVVTFNQQQRAHIESLLRDAGDDRLVEALDRRDGEGLFVKNLENVQGDERDVILFSTGFSANDKGVVPLNFGPLNRGGGERRLNVAVTRARRQVIVFSSFDPAMLRAEDTTSVGIKHLRAYLDLAAQGTAALESARQTTGGIDRHRDEVAEVLRGEGLIVHTDVGLSDFKIDLVVASPKRPEQPTLAVLLDGPGWAARRTVNDRDGLPSSVLSGLMGWPAVERVWMPAWINDHEPIVKRLVDAATTGRSVAAPVEPEPVVSQTTSAQTAASPAPPPAPDVPTTALETRFVSWPARSLGPTDVLDQLPSARSVSLVRTAIEEIVSVEGPIHLDGLAKKVAGGFNLGRVNANRIDAIRRCVPQDLLADPSEPFAWPRGVVPSEWLAYRRPSPDEPRTIESISLREIGNAMVDLAASCGGMNDEELRRDALAVFGGRRVTQGISERLGQALQQAVTSGRLVRQGDIFLAR